MPETIAYPDAPIAGGIRSRFADNGNGLIMHYLEAGFDKPPGKRPVALLLHGFPELAYSWRHVMPSLAEAGYRVLAPEQRGYGRTQGWEPRFDGDLAGYRVMNLVRDLLGLLHALGEPHVQAMVGHDFGAMVAAWAALMRPDVFRRLVLMSAPFAGPPGLSAPEAAGDIHADLAALARPRKHYQRYYSTAQAAMEMNTPPQGMHAFLRAYFHHKSADWPGNKPFRLDGWTAAELSKMPTYYVMDLAESMPETVAHEMPSAAWIAACAWLTQAELAVYAAEYARTGFQGGLEWYRARTGGLFDAEQQVFAGRTIDVPFLFVSGASDWGVRQTPGALEAMTQRACTDVRGVHLLQGAGHWVQQEQPTAVAELLADFGAG